MEETWKNIKGFGKLYQVSSNGEIRSFTSKNKGNKVKGWVQNTGYLTICLKNKKYSVHRLVAEAFIPNPNNYPIINHKDGNKLNNKVDNLEWCTYKHNYEEAIRLGLMKQNFPLKNNKTKAKKINQYDLQNTYIKTFECSVEAAMELKENGIKVNARNIRSVCSGERKTAGGFIWRYL